MEEHCVWVTTRRIKEGTLEEFERAWRPETRPEGMRGAFAYWSEDGQEVTGVSLWDSRQACDAWRSSDAEKRRREVMGPYVVDERESFHRGRELTLPAR
ncbi:antibiotic biosynthesis monooxygenase [Streptomyces sp. NPDC057011]|uniref:antibiotic biosynthesis monooxygenase n=1 Tax=unclassified Streptomyces TaxID=2593676 RepID=UPI0036451B53